MDERHPAATAMVCKHIAEHVRHHGKDMTTVCTNEQLKSYQRIGTKLGAQGVQSMGIFMRLVITLDSFRYKTIYRDDLNWEPHML